MRPLHGSLGRSSVVAGAFKSRSCRPGNAFCRQFASANHLERIRHRRAEGRSSMSDHINYNNWTKAGLIQRVAELEKELKASSAQLATPKCEPPSKEESPGVVRREAEDRPRADATPTVKDKDAKAKRKMDPSKYSTRHIALKLAYLGKNYGGFEFQAMGNQPSIEEELWNALTRACLISPGDERVVDFDCCEYSKCGRTDRGVSAFGQVIGLKVRSNRRPLPKKRLRPDGGEAVAKAVAAPGERQVVMEADRGEAAAAAEEEEEESQTKPFDNILDEIPYPHVLNRLLPKEIRILAWCPSPPLGFSARFSCRERQYRYFFTQPAFAPSPSRIEPPAQGRLMKPGWLDVEAMRDAAKRYEGEHDFRNFCKVDPAKQITNFSRTIFESDIVEVKDAASALPYLKAAGFAPQDSTNIADNDHNNSNAKANAGVYPKVYYFHVRGSAFLWHQIRHMVAILFLVGQGLEHPSLVTELLNVQKNPCRPNYVMADEVPLVLWDCIFPADLDASLTTESKDEALQWVYVGDDGPSGRFGRFGIMDDAWQMWREKKMDEVLAGRLLQHISQQGPQEGDSKPVGKLNVSTKLFEGGNCGRLGGKYVGVMNMKLLEAPDEQNDKYAKRKGFASAEDMRASKGGRGLRAIKRREVAAADEGCRQTR